MDLKFSFYGNDLPKVGEIVTILMKTPESDLISSTIEEYPNLSGIMEISDLTTKKRIKSVRQYLHKKPVPAEVTEIDEKTKIVSLTRRYLKTEGLYKRYYGEKLRLLTMARNLHRNFPKVDLDELVKSIIYPTMEKIIKVHDNKIEPPKIFEMLEVMFNENDLPDCGEYGEAFYSVLDKMYCEKPKKNLTNFSLMCSVSVRNIIELFEELSSEYPKVKFRLESTPEYCFETYGLESEEKEKHKDILKVLCMKCKEKRIVMKIT